MTDSLNLDQVQRQMIEEVLAKPELTRTQMAQALGISVRTLRNRIHQYGLEKYLRSNPEPLRASHGIFRVSSP